MIVLEQIRKRLINAIQDSDLTQKQICERLGIKPPTLSQYISGRAMPALDTFANLCVILKIDPAEILCVNEKKKVQSDNANRKI